MKVIRPRNRPPLPPKYSWFLFLLSGPDSSVGIATGYGLDGAGIESRWGRDFPPVQTGPGAHSASCTMGTGSFPAVKSGRGMTLNPQPLLVPWSRKSRDIPLLPLWTVRPVQSLSACTRVHFTSTFITVRGSVDPRATGRQEGLSHARCTARTFHFFHAAGLGAPYRC